MKNEDVSEDQKKMNTAFLVFAGLLGVPLVILLFVLIWQAPSEINPEFVESLVLFIAVGIGFGIGSWVENKPFWDRLPKMLSRRRSNFALILMAMLYCVYLGTDLSQGVAATLQGWAFVVAVFALMIVLAHYVEEYVPRLWHRWRQRK